MPQGDPFFPIAFVVLAVLFLSAMLVLLATRFKRCPSNKILVVFGKLTGSPTGVRCVQGGARFVLPLVQDYEFLDLAPIEIDVPLQDNTDAVASFTVAVGTEPQTMDNAAMRLLGLSTAEIKEQAKRVISERLQRERAGGPPSDRGADCW